MTTRSTSVQHHRTTAAGSIRRLVMVIAACSLFSGCANLYLHSEVRQKQGEAAQKAWQEVDSQAPFKAEQNNLNQLLDRELATQDRLATSIRNHSVRVLVAADSVMAGVVEPAQRALVALVGEDTGLFNKVIELRDEAAATHSQGHFSSEILLEANSPVTRCEDLDGGQLPAAAATWLATRTTDRVFLRVALDELVNKCAPLHDADARVATAERTLPKTSALARALKQLDEDRGALDAKQAEFAGQQKRYQEALKDHQAALAAATPRPDDQTLSAKVAQTAQLLKDAIDLLGATGNALSTEFIAQQTIDSVDAALKTIVDHSGKEAPEDAAKVVVVAVQLPALIDRFNQATAAARKPLALPLLIRRNHEQIKLDAAATDAKGLRTQVELSEAIVAATRDEALALRKVLAELADPSHQMPALGASALPAALAQATPRQRQLLYSACARYLDAIGRLQGERYRLEMMRIAVDHQRGLGYSEASAAQWNNLIGSGVGQVNEFAAGGVSKGLLTNIAGILSMLWIGHGVNQ